MLEELIVSNLGLIENAAVEPADGLVVVTGETGTGKTLLLGALDLVVGGVARKDVVGPHGDEATVQARFRFEDDERVVVRRVSRQGPSKAYVDGVMASARQLAATGEDTVEIIGQHDHLRLVSGSHVRSLLNAAFDAQARRAADTYAAAFETWTEVRRQAEELGGDRHGLERELEMARFQADEIAAKELIAGEDEDLARAANAHRNAAAIAEALDHAADGLGGSAIEPLMDQVVLALERVAALDPTQGQLASQALDVASLLGDLRSDVAGAAGAVTGDPAELDAIERRIAEIGDLKRKYGDSADEVIAFGERIAERAGELERLLAGAGELETKLRDAEAAVRRAGETLRRHRTRIGRLVAATAIGHLEELGFSSPRLEFAVHPREPASHGSDTVELLFASSVELEPRPVSRIASGGELSRLVLAIRLATGVADRALAAFDEIDAGVGGAAALSLGRKLAQLAEDRQVLCVTHLPQVAAYADTHIVVTRVVDTTHISVVDGESRVEELSRMLAGMPESERGREHAAELLAAAGADKP